MYAPNFEARSATGAPGRLPALACLVLLALMALHGLTGPPAMPRVPAAPGPALDLAALPLSFVLNTGQTDPAVKFQARSMGGTLFFTPGEVVLALPEGGGQERLDRPANTPSPAEAPPVVRLRFDGANPRPEISGAERMPGVANYLLGDDPARWRTGLPTYAGVVYHDLYPGVDLRYDGNEGLLKGTYTVAPGVDPSAIRWHYAGAQDVQVDKTTGDLHISLPTSHSKLKTQNPKLIEHAPAAWQTIDGQRVPIEVRYAVFEPASDPGQNPTVGFALGAYDASQPLTIDPAIEWSTYLGGRGSDTGQAIAVDGAGNVYITGATGSSDFPTAGALQPRYDGGGCEAATLGCGDAFVAKLNNESTGLVYSTFLGGTGRDAGEAIAIDSAGNAYVTGQTRAANFPTVEPFQGRSADGGCYIPDGGTSPCGDGFVAKLNAQGSGLVYSTYLTGAAEDRPTGITVDGAGNAYVTGTTYSADFPTVRALRARCDDGTSCTDAFVTKLNPRGSGLVYSTYLGGSADEYAQAVALDREGNAYVTGETRSHDFPTVNAIDSTFNGPTGGPANNFDAFVAKLNQQGSGLVYSTYLGDSDGDYGEAIAVDSMGQAYVTGYTMSPNFPTARPFQGRSGGGNCGDDDFFLQCGDAFVTKLQADGRTLSYSTFLGGSHGDGGSGIAVNGAGEASVTGITTSSNFPTARPLQGASGGGNCGDAQVFLPCPDAFVTRLRADGQALVHSTYLGGSGADESYGLAIDSAGNSYVTGSTQSKDFPLVRPFQSPLASSDAAFVVKIGENAVATDPAFFGVWASTDRAVREGTTGRSWLWGPAPFTTTSERYTQSPGEQRLVEYYDKARMEINNPGGDRANRFFVTNGLLPIELISGRLKSGDAPTQFEQRQPADAPVAGDAAEANANAPTYRSLAQVATVDVAAAPRRAPAAVGSSVVATLNKAGQVGQDQGLSRYGVRIGRYSEELGHNVPEVFGRYLDSLPLPAIFVMGLPISEPYWAKVRVGGVERDVLMQVYERRVLTFTPSNPPEFQVEMGNVGQHYYRWRYGATPWQR